MLFKLFIIKMNVLMADNTYNALKDNLSMVKYGLLEVIFNGILRRVRTISKEICTGTRSTPRKSVAFTWSCSTIQNQDKTILDWDWPTAKNADLSYARWLYILLTMQE
jgi:hypothetical protein